MQGTGELLINGVWQTGSGPAFSSMDPVYGDMLWEGASATLQEVDAAVTAAQQAFSTWAKTVLVERLRICERFQQLLTDRQVKLAKALAKETGKVLWEAQAEITAMIGKIAISARAYEERTGCQTQETQGLRTVLRHKPHGVLAVFGPYNFPGHLPNGHIVPALLAGNSIVYKPSEQTPHFAKLTVQLWQEAGLPKGVLNLVQGGVSTGMALAKHPLLSGLLFTGSSKTGKWLHKQFGGQPEKLLALEMGGNNPLIIWEAQSLTAAAYYTIQSAFISSGQRCTCARRLIIPQGEAGDAILDHLLSMTKNVRVAAYDATPQPFMASLISAEAAKQMLSVQNKLHKAGAKVLLAMKALQPGTGLLTPGILDVTGLSEREDTEHFGPLLQVVRVPDFQAAITEANRTAYGLAAGILTDNPELYELYLLQSRAGIVNWNRPTTGASSALPFGGIGASGNYHPSAYYAADYCAYPVASMESVKLQLPDTMTPGVRLSS